MLARFLIALAVASAPAGEGVTLEGKLVVENPQPYVERDGKRVPLEGGDNDLAATLGDARVSGRKVKLAGELRSDGTLVVHQLHIVRPDALYRILYYCYT